MTRITRRYGVVLASVLAVAAAGSGCVLVVGGDGHARPGQVEWSGSRDYGTGPVPGTADGRLAREVEARIRTDSALAREDITVSSRGEVVTLHGRIADLALLEHVMRLASEVPGVTRVVSRLTVEMEAH